MNGGYSKHVRRRLEGYSRALLAGLLVALSVAGCGGGGGGGGGGQGPPTTPPPPARMFSWTAAGSPGGDSLYLDVRGNGSPDRFVIQLRASQVTDLYGIALDVVYPPNLVTLDFDAVEEGGFFSAGGSLTTEFQITEMPEGRIIIGITRVGDASGRSGDGLILDLPFDTTASGSGELMIEALTGIASDGAPVAISGLGGTFEIQL